MPLNDGLGRCMFILNGTAGLKANARKDEAVQLQCISSDTNHISIYLSPRNRLPSAAEIPLSNMMTSDLPI